MQKHKILAFLLALIVSIGLWVYAVTVVNPDGTTTISNVRVRIIGTNALTSNNLMLTGGEDQTVDVEIAGRRSDLKVLNSSTLEATADVKNIDRAGTYEVSWELGFPPTVASGDIRVVSTSSTRITVKVSEYQERHEIPVEVVYSGSLPDNYLRDPAVLDQETVAVNGPAEEVSKISRAILTVDVDGAKESIEEEMAYVLVDENGDALELSDYVTVVDPTIRVSVPIFFYKDIKLRVNVIESDGAKKENAVVTIEPDTIRVTGSEEALKDLEELVIKEIDLAQITEPQTWTVLPDLPSGVTNRASDKSVQVSIRFKNLTTKRINFPCSEIERINDVETMEFSESNIVIVIRGTAAAVGAISEEDISVIADMTDGYDDQTKTVTLQIVLPKGAKVDLVGAPYVAQVIGAVA